MSGRIDLQMIEAALAELRATHPTAAAILDVLVRDYEARQTADREAALRVSEVATRDQRIADAAAERRIQDSKPLTYTTHHPSGHPAF